MTPSRLRFNLASAALAGALAVSATACSDGDNSSGDRDTPSGDKDAAEAPGEVQHLGMFTPPDLYAGGETEVRGTLALNEPGCLTLDGTLVAFPRGSEVSDDGAIRMPDGKVLRWWVPTAMSTFPTRPNKHTANQPTVGIAGLDACTPDLLPAVTLVTFLPDSCRWTGRHVGAPAVRQIRAVPFEDSPYRDTDTGKWVKLGAVLTFGAMTRRNLARSVQGSPQRSATFDEGLNQLS